MRSEAAKVANPGHSGLPQSLSLLKERQNWTGVIGGPMTAKG
jgi:hypothetical protein